MPTVQRNYVLPPLIGLPYDQMVANGQGVRHAGIPRYHKLIIAHAVFMVIPFLFLIPISLFFARYRKHAEPRQAIQWHFILNTATIVFITIGFILAYFAVDKGTWGSNPHHIIGVTIYAGVIVQACFGVLLRKREEKKIRKLGEVGLRGMMHAWFGRGIYLLGVAQIPLGFYLYGTTLVFFILYGAMVFFTFGCWFIFEYVHGRRQSRYQITMQGSVRGGQARSDMSSGHQRRHPSHSGVSYTEMTETTHAPPTTATPGTYLTRTSMDGGGAEYTPGLETGNAPTAELPQHQTPTTPKMSRLNRLSVSIGNRFRRKVSSNDGGVGGTPGSMDTSTRPPTGGSHNLAGLYPPPNAQQRVPMPPLVGAQIATVGDLEQHHYRRNEIVAGGAATDPLKDNSNANANNRSMDMPSIPPTTLSPVSPPSSPGIVHMPSHPNVPPSDVSSLSSERIGKKYSGHIFSPLLPPARETPMPSSPMGDQYLSAEEDEGPISPPQARGKKYHPIPSNPPRVPLPMPPEPVSSSSAATSSRRHHHRRDPSDTSTLPDAVIRIPLSRHSQSMIDVPAGELIRNTLPPGESPQVAVQVKVDRSGRSVSVRRVTEDEANGMRGNSTQRTRERERAERERGRAHKAEERERLIEREAREKKRESTGTSNTGRTTTASISEPTPPVELPASSKRTPMSLTPVKPLNIVKPAKASSRPLAPPSEPSAVSDQRYADSQSETETEYTDSELSYDDATTNPGSTVPGGQVPRSSAGSRVGSALGSRVGSAAGSRLGSAIGGAGRESVVSAAMTDDAEAEERIRERRRRKRREERNEGMGGFMGTGAGGRGSGNGSGGNGSGATGGYYGGSVMSGAGTNIEWT